MLQGALNSTDSFSTARSFQGFLAPKNPVIAALIQGYLFLVNAVSIPSRLFLRDNMGERAFNVLGFILVVLFIFIYGFLGVLLAQMGLQPLEALNLFSLSGIEFWKNLLLYLLLLITNPLSILLILISVKGVKHFKEAIRKAKSNEVGYSFYRGDSIYFKNKIGKKIFGFSIDETNLRMLYEPYALIRISFFLFSIGITLLISRRFWTINPEVSYFFDPFISGLSIVGLTMMLSSFCLFLEEFGIMMKTRNMVLDMIDRETDMKIILSLKEKMLVHKDTQIPLEDTENENFTILNN